MDHPESSQQRASSVPAWQTIEQETRDHEAGSQASNRPQQPPSNEPTTLQSTEVSGGRSVQSPRPLRLGSAALGSNQGQAAPPQAHSSPVHTNRPLSRTQSAPIQHASNGSHYSSLIAYSDDPQPPLNQLRQNRASDPRFDAARTAIRSMSNQPQSFHSRIAALNNRLSQQAEDASRLLQDTQESQSELSAISEEVGSFGNQLRELEAMLNDIERDGQQANINERGVEERVQQRYASAPPLEPNVGPEQGLGIGPPSTFWQPQPPPRSPRPPSPAPLARDQVLSQSYAALVAPRQNNESDEDYMRRMRAAERLQAGNRFAEEEQQRVQRLRARTPAILAARSPRAPPRTPVEPPDDNATERAARLSAYNAAIVLHEQHNWIGRRPLPEDFGLLASDINSIPLAQAAAAPDGDPSEGSSSSQGSQGSRLPVAPHVPREPRLPSVGPPRTVRTAMTPLPEGNLLYVGGSRPLFRDESEVDLNMHIKQWRDRLSRMIYHKVGLPPVQGAEQPPRSVKIELPKYKGEDDVDKFMHFLKELLRYFSTYKIIGDSRDNDRLTLLGSCLAGIASTWYDDEVDSVDRADDEWWFEKAIIGLYRRCIHEATAQNAVFQFQKCSFKPIEGISSFYETLQRYANRMVQKPTDYEFNRKFMSSIPASYSEQIMKVNQLTSENATSLKLRDAA